MSKIAIVGVEGCGKTVLLSAIGEKYENPDISGIFMSPVNERAFEFVKLHMASLRQHQWPAATTTNSNLDWGLFLKRKSGGNAKICDLSLLDFAGELYRLTFGNHTEEECAGYESEIKVVKDHIKKSDVLLVVVNLSDVINGSVENRRTRETMWLTKSVIDYTVSDKSSKKVAIVFTQADSYKSVIEKCGGEFETLQTYLPHVASLYDKLPIFSVSAVNKTVPGSDGKPIPAPDFQPEGIDELMEWIISTIPDYDDLSVTMRERRLAPITLAKELEELQKQYESDECRTSTIKRNEILVKIISIIQALRQANAVSSCYAQLADKLDEIEKKFSQCLENEKCALEIIDAVTTNDISTAESMLKDWVKKSDWFVAHEAVLREEIDERHGLLRQREEIRRKKKRRMVVSLSLVMCCVAGAACWGYREKTQRDRARYLAECEAKGYIIERGDDGVLCPVWVAGRQHPKNKDLKSLAEKEKWECTKLGYRWDGECGIRWVPGIVHPNNELLKTSEKRDAWDCEKTGYEWDGATGIVWKVGLKHPTNEWLVSSEKEGVWKSSRPGYEWDGAVLKWAEGKKHSKNSDLVSSDKMDEWICTKSGYEWDGGASIKWKSGVEHPNNNLLVSSITQDKWDSKKPGYIWSGGADIKWQEGLVHSGNTSLVSSKEQDVWICTEPGYVWDGGTGKKWKAGLTSVKYPHCITSKEEGNWHPMDGYKWVDPKSPKFDVVWNPNWKGADKQATEVEGVFKYKRDCPECYNGKVSCKVRCSSCGGDGEKRERVDCSRCDGDGRVSTSSSCWRCSGRGSVTIQCPDCGIVNNGAGFIVSYHGQVCDNCGGNGRVIYRPSNYQNNGQGLAGVFGALANGLNEGARALQAQQHGGWTYCNKCSGRGWYHHSTCNATGQLTVDCSNCNGSGSIRGSTNCSSCSGLGKKSVMVNCSRCINGKVDGEEKCSSCEGEGYVWENKNF